MSKLSQMLDMSLDEVISKTPNMNRGAGSTADSGGRGCRVFVGNLPYSVTWQDLKDVMRQIGKVVHCDIIPEFGTTLGSKGCGLVEFESPKDAKRAIQKLNDTNFNGRQIFLREDREEGCTSGRSQSRKTGSGSRSRSRSPHVGGVGAGGGLGTTVYIGNLPYSVTWQHLKDHMRACGNVVRCDVLRDANGSKGCGLVEYSRPVEAKRAIRELHDSELKGRPIFVREDREAKTSTLRDNNAAYKSFQSCSFRFFPDASLRSRVFVGNLSYSVTADELADLMSTAGDVLDCRIIPEPGTACGSKGCAIVQYGHIGDAEWAVRRLTDKVLNGRPIFVREDREG